MSVEHISLSEIKEVYENLKKYPDIFFQTPLLHNVERFLRKQIPAVKSLSLKMETMQYTGSFKARGVVNQFISLNEDASRRTLVTMSAGNYGKAFAIIADLFNIPAVVFMPETAPLDRKFMIESYGASVVRCPTTELMQNVIQHTRQHGSLFLHSFDDPVLIKGHTSAGLELFEQLATPPDIVIICCGGGGFLAGTALAMRLSGWNNTRIYGVEPENAPTMHDAMKAGKIVQSNMKTTIASGLAPPFAGENCFKLIQKYVNDILLVSDDEIRGAVRTLYKTGFVVEPSGSAAFAALLYDKVPDVIGKDIVVFLTGSNVSPEDLAEHCSTGK